MDGQVINPVGEHKNTVIFMHGLGDTCDGWASLMPQLRLKNTKFILPNAPTQGVTLNGGMKMPSWYDIRGLSSDAEEDIEGVQRSTERILKVIDEEVASGVDPKRIIIGGFSQGGALAIYGGLRCKHPLGGIVALSTYLIGAKTFPEGINLERVSAIPIFQAHGTQDQVVALTWGEMSKDALLSNGCNVAWKTYPMQHSSHPREINDLRAFLQNILS